MTMRLMKLTKRWMVGTAVAGMTLAAVPALADGTAHSLDQARGKLATPDARAAYDREMGGSQADGFGTRLPAGFTKAFVVAQVAPGQNPAHAVLVGVKPWPQRANAFVAVVCMAPDDATTRRILQFNPPTQCDGFDLDASANTFTTQLWLGVFEQGADGVPHLVARTDSPIDQATDWSTTNIDAPDMLDAMPAGSDQTLRPQQWLRFDLAAYQLRENDYAFGVRAGWSVGYAGGGASFEALYLFRVDGHTIRFVFAQPMMYFRNIAGDWHKDGTRDHDMTDASNALSVLPTSTHGFRDWQLRQRGGKWRQTFTWSPDDRAYVPQ